MKYKGYISKSYFDPTTWDNHVVKNDLWERTFTEEDADFIIYVNDSKITKLDKFKILYLIECEDILNTTYNNIVNRLEPNLIVTYNNTSFDGIKTINTLPPFKSWITEPSVYSKTKLCSMISSMLGNTNLQQYRVGVYNKFKNIVDCYGKHTNYIENKITGLQDYCFSIAIENSSVPGYFTEKILDCFLTGTVPVYLGDPDIGKHFDERGIILYTDNFDINELSFERYYDMLPYIKHNYEVAKRLNISFEDYFMRGVHEYEHDRKN